MRPALLGLFELAIVGQCGSWAGAEVALPAILSDHMVLQRTDTARLWGTAQPDMVAIDTMLQLQSGG